MVGRREQLSSVKLSRFLAQVTLCWLIENKHVLLVKQCIMQPQRTATNSRQSSQRRTE